MEWKHIRLTQPKTFADVLVQKTYTEDDKEKHEFFVAHYDENTDEWGLYLPSNNLQDDKEYLNIYISKPVWDDDKWILLSD